MANWNDPNMAPSGFGAGANAMDQAVDAGLRSYMLSVYNYMGSGVLLNGLVAIRAYTLGFTVSMLSIRLLWVSILAPLAFVMGLSFGMSKLSARPARTLCGASSTALGSPLSTPFLASPRTHLP